MTLVYIAVKNHINPMADVAQLVRALVCGTRCREFESHHPPHKKIPLHEGFFLWNDDDRFERTKSEFETSLSVASATLSCSRK